MESALSFVIADPGVRALTYWRSEDETRGVPPHITVLYPWRPAPVSESDIDEARATVAGLGPIEVELNAIASFPAGVVYAAVADHRRLVELMRGVWRCFPETPPYGGEHREPVPHLTLAKCEPNEIETVQARVAAEVAGVLPLQLVFSELMVLEQGDDGRWLRRAALSLS